jgi:lactoylglutathione lyase
MIPAYANYCGVFSAAHEPAALRLVACCASLACRQAFRVQSPGDLRPGPAEERGFLRESPQPFHDGRHIWFRISEHGQLHVVGGATQPAPTTIDVHQSFRVASIHDFMAHLDTMQIKYRSFKGDTKFTARPDGITQIYFQDPDGYWIEVNDDKY